MQCIREANPDGLGKLIAVDLPGHGSAQDEQSGFQPDELVDFIIRKVPPSVFDRPTVIVAQSFSGVAAAAMSRRLKNIVLVVMLDTPLRVSSAFPSMALLIHRYRQQKQKYAWIPKLLSDFFHCEADRIRAKDVRYYENVAAASAPVVMITGEIKVVRALCRREPSIDENQGGDSNDVDEKVVVGSHNEVIDYAEKHGLTIVHSIAGACFTGQDLLALKELGVGDFKVHSLPDTGHNVLVPRNVHRIADIILSSIAERLCTEAR